MLVSHCATKFVVINSEFTLINLKNNKQNFIAYDFAYIYGGAESVLVDICNAMSTKELHLSFTVPSIANQLLSLGISPIALSNEPRLHYPFSHAVKAMMTFAQYRNTSKFNNAIASGYYAPLCLPSIQAERKIYYCHTPPRFLFDLRRFYEEELGIFSPVLKLLDQFYLPRYISALEAADIVIANSKNVQQRLTHYLKVRSEVIYPSIDVARYECKPSQGFYLSLARHEKYKRLDIIIQAFKRMPEKKLVIASSGSLTESLKASAAGFDNIVFTGWLNNNELKTLLSECIASIYIPMNEDFGISPLESMASGKPVIGVNEGGVAETIVHEQTGYLCKSSPLAQHVIDAVYWMTQYRATLLKSASLERAKLFDISVFRKRMNDLVD